jgi:phospholipid/cholesterol/gamma-HCH transport system substrate-binding protein
VSDELTVTDEPPGSDALRGRTLGDQIRRNAATFAAIIALLAMALFVGVYVMSHERLTLPGWVPIIGKSFYTIRGDFQTAQAVAPGQGQAVTIAGVKIGEIDSVTLVGGQALVSMHIDKRYAPVYADATMLLRPKTQLKDMTVELNKGTPAAGALPSGATLPISQTAPDINLDEVLSSLDADTRAYLQLLINGGGTALRGQGVVLSNGLRRFDPTARDLAKIGSLLAQRQANLARVIHNLSLLTGAISTRDTQLASLVDSSNAVFEAFARENANVSSTIALLPGTLSETQGALGKATQAADALNAALTGLLPTARALGPGLVANRSLFRTTTPVLANQLRPFVRASIPTAKLLAPATADLASASPDLTTGFSVLGELLNELAYNPGPGKASFLFYMSWANHNLNSLFSTSDAHGATRQGLLLFSCPALQVLQGAAQINPFVGALIGLLNPPPTSQVCGSSGAAATASSVRSRLPTAASSHAAPRRAGSPNAANGPAGATGPTGPIGAFGPVFSADAGSPGSRGTQVAH